MQQDMEELYNHYLKIKERGWVKSRRSGPGGIGYTFESLLGKEEDTFPLPDFGNIEIKTMRKNSRGKLHLLNVTPDGDFLFPLKRILDKLGYPSKRDPGSRVFMMSVNAQEYTKVGSSKRIKLRVNRDEEKLELIAESIKGKNLNIDVSWSFQILKEYLELKLKYLAIIKADNQIINGEEYFKYSEIMFYQLKDFESFIRLIEYGVITVTFNIGVFKKGKRAGQIHDRGTNFSLNIGYLCNLYKKIIIKI